MNRIKPTNSWMAQIKKYSREDTKRKTVLYIDCPDCQKIARETTYFGSPMMCRKHQAEAVIESLGGRVVWPPSKKEVREARERTSIVFADNRFKNGNMSDGKGLDCQKEPDTTQDAIT
jgi:ribosomal protein S27E